MMDIPSALELFGSFERIAGRDPGRPLVLAPDAGPMLTAGALLDRVLATAREVRSAGVSPGDLVLIERLPGVSLLVALLAVWACDAVAMPVETGSTAAEIELLRRMFHPVAAITPGPVGTQEAAVSRVVPASGGESAAPLPAGSAYVKLTSGSTGRPRGIPATASQLLADARHIIEGMDVAPDLVNIAAISLSHSYGLASLVLPLVIQGSPLLLVPAAAGQPLVRALSIDRPAFFPGVPVLYETLARADAPAIVPRGLRTCISAGAPLRSRTAEAFRRRTGVAVRAFYGTSETGGICFDASPEGDAAETIEGCVGTPLPGVHVTLEGEEGRVVVSSDAVAHGYVGAGATAVDGGGEFLAGGFRTGDTGRFDDGGGRRSLCLTGRAGSVVNVSGRKVNPVEVEAVLSTMPGVRDAAVLGVPDESRGEALVACLVADPGVSRDDVVAHLRAALAAHKIPRRFLFMNELARTARGKLDMESLRRAAADARGGVRAAGRGDS